jgi:signal peptidase I|tara:strand:+ start:211 stop:468 length:258 start_codon:yes stop_codon:yes gene_type:complete
MKKIAYVLLALTALFVNTTVFAAEARVPSTSFSKALQIAKNRDDYVVLKSAKFDVKEKTYNISYVTKNGNVETLKISKISGKEVK